MTKNSKSIKYTNKIHKGIWRATNSKEFVLLVDKDRLQERERGREAGREEGRKEGKKETRKGL